MANLVFQFPQGETTWQGFLKFFDSLTDVGSGGNLGLIIMIVMAGGLFMMMRGSAGVKKAFATMTVINAIVAVLFRIMSLVNDYVLTASVVLGGIGLWMLIADSARYE